MSEPLSELPSAPFEARGFHLAAKPAGHIVMGLAFADTAPPDAGPSVLRAAGPRRWLLIGDARLTYAELAERERSLGLALIDLSHARERLELSGPGAADRLTTGTALNIAALSEGASAQTLFGAFAVHLTRTGPQIFELLIGRTFAWSLWLTLTAPFR